MNAENEDFSKLRKLLAVKRHEQPPPGYFNSFSGNVMARLRTPELLPGPTWLQRLGLDFNLRPAMVCALGVVMSALLLTGTITSMQRDAQAFPAIGLASMDTMAWGGNPALAPAPRRILAGLEMAPASTSPVFNAPAASPFSDLAVQASKANWAFAYGN